MWLLLVLQLDDQAAANTERQIITTLQLVGVLLTVQVTNVLITFTRGITSSGQYLGQHNITP